MSIRSISTKELREQMPKVRAGLAQGDQYALIYRSKIIARIEPVQQTPTANKKIKGGGLRLQSNHPNTLTPAYLKELSANRYE